MRIDPFQMLASRGSQEVQPRGDCTPVEGEPDAWKIATTPVKPVGFRLATLETSPIEVTDETVLSFDVETHPQRLDALVLEISQEGERSFEPLASYERKLDHQSETVSLSDYEGQAVRLRFSWRPGSYYNHDGNAVVSRIRVSSGSNLVFNGDPSPPSSQDLDWHLNQVEPDLRVRAVGLMLQLADGVGGVRTAAQLWPLIDSRVEHPDCDEFVSGLVQLTNLTHASEVPQIWGELERFGNDQTLSALKQTLARVAVDDVSVREALADITPSIEFDLDPEFVRLGDIQTAVRTD